MSFRSGAASEVIPVLLNAKTTAKSFHWFTAIAAVCGFFVGGMPESAIPMIIVLGSIPLVALAMAWKSGGRYSLSGLSIVARPSLAFELVVPGWALLANYAMDLNNFVDWKVLLLATLGLSAVLAVVIKRADTKTKWSASPAILPLLLQLVFAWGLIAQTDVHLDRSTPVIYDVRVSCKHESWHKGGRDYFLEVVPWEPVSAPDEFRVRTAVYDSAVPGRTVPIALHTGTLGIRWYTALESADR